MDNENTPRIPEGTYRARAVGGALGETSKGAPQIAVEFQFLDEGWENTRITWFGYFTPKTEERTIQALRYAGWTGDDLSDLAGLGSREVQLEIEHDTYEGKTRAKVKWVNSGGGLALKAPMKADAAKAFAAKMKGKVVAVTKAMPAMPAAEDVEPF